MSHPSAVDHDALWRDTKTTLASMSSLKIASYRIKRISGAEVFVGGFGDVEQAELRESLFGANAIMALKRLRPTGDRAQRIRVIASLARELYVWHKLHHPNILALEGFYYDESSLKTAWIVTRWQKNGNVLKYVEATNADTDMRRKLALDTARGLTYLHGLSPPVCHADIKVENTLVNDSGDAMLCDFGLARILQEVPSGLTTTSAQGCTFRYAPPELVVGDGLHSLAGDVWSWGCLLLVILTGLVPYTDKDRDATIAWAISRKQLPTDLSSKSLNVNDYVRSILSSCWQYKRNVRPSIDWCRKALTTESALLFDNICSTPQDLGANTLQLPRNTASMLASLAYLRRSIYSVEPIPHVGAYEGSFGPVRRGKIHSKGSRHIHKVIVEVIQPKENWTQHMPVLDALIQELHYWNKIQHENVLPLLGFYFNESFPASSVWTVTPWLSNGSVTTYLKDRKPAVDARIKLALDVAKGLTYLHQLSPPIYHGNLDADRVLVDAQGHPHIGGLGFTRALQDFSNSFPPMTTLNSTLRYASPERIALGEPERSRGSDVWAWGCFLLVVITDIVPYADCAEETAILESIGRGELPANTSAITAPSFIKVALDLCWDKDPESRLHMGWCYPLFTHKSTNRFGLFTKLPFEEVPEQWKSGTRSLQTIFNPESQTVHHVEGSWSFGRTEEFRLLDVSLDGKQAVAADWYTLFIYNIAAKAGSKPDTSRPLLVNFSKSFPFSRRIIEARFDPSHSLIATGHLDGSISIWRLATRTLHAALEGTPRLQTIAFGTSDFSLKVIAVRKLSMFDTAIEVWDVETGSLQHTTPAPAPFSCELVRAPHHRLVWAEGGGTVVHHIRDGSSFRIPGHKSAVLTPDGSSLITIPTQRGQGGEVLKGWDLPPFSTAQARREQRPKNPSPFHGPQEDIDALAISSDGHLVASGSSRNGDLLIWDMEARLPVVKIRGSNLYKIQNVTFQPGSTSSKGCILYCYQDGPSEVLWVPRRRIRVLRYKKRSP